MMTRGKRFTLLGALTLTSVLGSGCGSLFGNEGFFRDRGDDYLQADVIAPMQLPEGVQSRQLEQLYAIPSEQNIDITVAEEFEVPRPQPLATSSFDDKVKIQKLGDKRWILVSSSPSDVWPAVRNFLAVNKLEVVYTDATRGVIETGWLQFKDDVDTKNKYRIQIEQGVQPENAEIHILHMSVARDVPGRGQVNWPERSISAERESWLLDEIAATLATDESGQVTSLLAQTIGINDKVKLSQKNGEPVLELALDYTRSWATVNHAVQQEGFRLWEQDTATGIYYVDYHEVNLEDDEPGFFASLFGADGKASGTLLAPYRLQDVLNHLQLEDTPANRAIFTNISGTKAEPLKDVPGYLVVVRDAGNNKVEVHIRDGYAKPLTTVQAKQLLNIIRHNLI